MMKTNDSALPLEGRGATDTGNLETDVHQETDDNVKTGGNQATGGEQATGCEQATAHTRNAWSTGEAGRSHSHRNARTARRARKRRFAQIRDRRIHRGLRQAAREAFTPEAGTGSDHAPHPEPRDFEGYDMHADATTLLHRQMTYARISDRATLTRTMLVADTVVALCPDAHLEDGRFPTLQAFAMFTTSLLEADDLCLLSKLLDCTTTQAYIRAREAVVACYGMHRSFRMAESGRLSAKRLTYAARKARHLSEEKLERFDVEFTQLRPSVTWKSFTKAVRELLLLIDPPEDVVDLVHERRRVDLYTDDGQRGQLVITGPILPLAALHARLDGMARAIRKGAGGAFGLDEDTRIVDERSTPQLMFDMLANWSPNLSVEAARRAQTGSPTTGASPGGLPETIDIACPSDGEWLRRQASVVVTVPALTLSNADTLPGTFADGSPVHPDIARRVASESNVFWRILTDPATGAIIDETARSYRIPQAMRMTIDQKHPWCTAPGCTRRSATCEKDHLDPFDHMDPGSGGRTDLHNLHPLCKKHHQMKTQNILRVEHGPDGMIRWLLPRHLTSENRAPDRPIDAEHATRFAGDPEAPGSDSERPAGDPDAPAGGDGTLFGEPEGPAPDGSSLIGGPDDHGSRGELEPRDSFDIWSSIGGTVPDTPGRDSHASESRVSGSSDFGSDGPPPF